MKRVILKMFMGIAAAVMITSASGVAAEAKTVPAAYQYDVEKLKQVYPGTRMQGKYGTCWAFSFVGLAEFDLIHDDKIADKNIDLSELQLAYYTYHNEVDPLGGTRGDSLVTDDYLNTGGVRTYVASALLQWQGLIPEASLPYDQAEQIKNLDSSLAFSKDVAHLQNVYILKIHQQPQDVKKEIMKHGAASISYYTTNKLGRYDTKAFYDRTGDTVATYYCPARTADLSGHTVNIVGWDDEFPAENFKSKPEGDGAWLVRNSWSTQTGSDIRSYFWLSYYDKGLEDNAWVLDFEPADNYDFNYQYDGCARVGKRYNTPVCANVFQVKGAANEQLKAVSVTMNEEEDVWYTIKIYTNLTEKSNPRSGILAAKVSGKKPYKGTVTIPLKNAVSLQKGTNYAVVVELDPDVGVDVELSAETLNYEAIAHIEPNQSFIYKNGKWNDLADSAAYNHTSGNLCIKAFTDKSGSDIGKVGNLKNTGNTKDSAKLSWSKVSGAEGYEIYRATSKTGTYKKVATTQKTSYRDVKLASKHTYYYKVRAYKSNGSNLIEGNVATVKSRTR